MVRGPHAKSFAGRTRTAGAPRRKGSANARVANRLDRPITWIDHMAQISHTAQIDHVAGTARWRDQPVGLVQQSAESIGCIESMSTATGQVYLTE
ncbi:hypothetical protein KRMM14A1004_53880 [Krasilnikovia sp. MM14-A1004]